MTSSPRNRDDTVDVRMASERTLLSWVRTGLAMMGFGFVIARFGFAMKEFAMIQGIKDMTDGRHSLWIGATLVSLGVAVNLVAATQHVRFLRRLQAGEVSQPSAFSLGVVVSAALALLGIGMTVYLFGLGN